MKIKLLLILGIVLFFSLSFSTISKKLLSNEIQLFHRVIENDTSTIITNLYDIDSIFIKGKWNRVIFKGYSDHGIQLLNNDTLISFFPYQKNKSMVYNKKLSNEKFFKRYQSDRIFGWNNMSLNNRKIKSDVNFSIHYVENKLILIGAKGKNTYFITYFTPENINEEKKISFLIKFFNEIKE